MPAFPIADLAVFGASHFVTFPGCIQQRAYETVVHSMLNDFPCTAVLTNAAGFRAVIPSSPVANGTVNGAWLFMAISGLNWCAACHTSMLGRHPGPVASLSTASARLAAVIPHAPVTLHAIDRAFVVAAVFNAGNLVAALCGTSGAVFGAGFSAILGLCGDRTEFSARRVAARRRACTLRVRIPRIPCANDAVNRAWGNVAGFVRSRRFAHCAIAELCNGDYPGTVVPACPAGQRAVIPRSPVADFAISVAGQCVADFSVFGPRALYTAVSVLGGDSSGSGCTAGVASQGAIVPSVPVTNDTINCAHMYAADDCFLSRGAGISAMFGSYKHVPGTAVDAAATGLVTAVPLPPLVLDDAVNSAVLQHARVCFQK